MGMASVNEEVNFKVNFEDDDMEKQVASVRKVQKAYEDMQKSAEKLSDIDLFDVDNIEDYASAMKGLQEHIANIKKLMAAVKADKSGADYSENFTDLNATLRESEQLLNSITQKVADMHKQSRQNVGGQETRGMSTEAALAQNDENFTRYYREQNAQLERRNQLERAFASYQENRERRQREINALNQQTADQLGYELATLSSGVNDIEQTYKDMFSSGDFSGLRQANEQMMQLRNRAEELKQEIAEASARGVDTTQLQQSLASIEGRLRSIAETIRSQMRQKLIQGFKQAFNTLDRVATTTFRAVFRTANTLTRGWGKLLAKTFRKEVASWNKLLSMVFSGGTQGKNTIASQLKSLMGIASLAGFVALSKQAIQLSASIFEVQNVIDTVFPEMSEQINDFTDNAVEAFGLTQLEAKQMVGTFGAMLSASDISSKAQAEMSKNLTALTGDLASFYNLDTGTVFKKLQSGLQGNVAAMRSFGVNLSKANLEAFALSRGIKTSYAAMSQAQKTALRYNYMLEQLSMAQGDVTRTSGTWANQMRQLTGNFKQLMAILGGGLIKALYPTLTILNQIVVAAINAANALAKLFGFEAADLSKLFGSKGAVLPDVEGYAEDLGDVADATDDVAEATKRANENLQTFDKLNNLKTPSTEDTTLDQLGDIDTGELIDFDSYYEKIDKVPMETNERLQAILDVLKKWAKDIGSVDYSDFIKSWSNLKSNVGILTEDVGDGVLWLWDNVLFPFYKWGAQQGSSAVLDLLASSLSALHEIIVAVSPEIDDFWKETLAPFFSKKGDQFTDTLKKWTNGIDDWTEGLRNANDKVGYLKKTFKDIKKKIYGWIDDEGITSRLDSIAAHLKSIFSKIITPETAKQASSLLHTFVQLKLITFNNILKVIDYIVGNEKVADFVGFLVDEFGELADFTFDELIEVIDYVAGSDKARNIITNIKESIMNIIQWIVDHKETILGLLETASNVVKFLSEHLGAVLGILIAIKGIQAFGTIVIGAGNLIKAFGEIRTLAGSMGGWFSSASAASVGALSLVVAECAAVVLAVEKIGEASYNYTKQVKENGQEFDDAWSRSEDTLERLTYGQEQLLRADDFGDYSIKLKNLGEAFNDLDERMKTLISSNGKLTDFATDIGTSAAQKQALQYADALREAGYANDTLVEKLEQLGNTEITPFNTHQLKQDIISTMREIEMSVETEAATLMSATDDEIQKIRENFQSNALATGMDWSTSWSEGLQRNLSVFDEATGMMYDRLTGNYREIINDADRAGADTIVGFVEGMNGEQEYLILASGYMIDTATTALVKMPESFKETAQASIEGMSLVFNEDGTIEQAVSSMVDTALGGQGITAETEAIDTSSSYTDTLAEEISSNTTVQEAVLQLFENSFMGIETESVVGKAQEVSQAYIDKIVTTFSEDTSINEAATAMFESAFGSISESVSTSGSDIANAYTTSINTALSEDSTIKSTVENTVNTSFLSVKDKLKQIGEQAAISFINGVTSRLRSDRSIASTVSSSITSAFSLSNNSAKTGGYNIGVNIVSGIAQGVRNNSGALSSAINSIANNMLNQFRRRLKIHSPSQVFADSAEFIPAGIGVGITDNADEAYSSIDTLVSSMLAKFSDTDIDMTAMLNTSGFSDKYKDILYETDIFTKDLNSKYKDISPVDMQSNMVTSPSVKRAELSANVAQNSTTARLEEGMAAMYTSKARVGADKIEVNLNLSGNKMATFIIDTVTGKVIQTGDF